MCMYDMCNILGICMYFSICILICIYNKHIIIIFVYICMSNAKPPRYLLYLFGLLRKNPYDGVV